MVQPSSKEQMFRRVSPERGAGPGQPQAEPGLHNSTRHFAALSAALNDRLRPQLYFARAIRELAVWASAPEAEDADEETLRAVLEVLAQQVCSLALIDGTAQMFGGPCDPTWLTVVGVGRHGQQPGTRLAALAAAVILANYSYLAGRPDLATAYTEVAIEQVWAEPDEHTLEAIIEHLATRLRYQDVLLGPLLCKAATECVARGRLAACQALGADRERWRRATALAQGIDIGIDRPRVVLVGRAYQDPDYTVRRTAVLILAREPNPVEAPAEEPAPDEAVATALDYLAVG